MNYVETELAPLADQQLTNARRIGKAGDFDAIRLLEAVKAAHEAKLQILDAQLDFASNSRRLQALLEAGMWNSTSQKRTQ